LRKFGRLKLPPFYDICGGAKEFAEDDFVVGMEVEMGASGTSQLRMACAIIRA
jgi:hypothetical protein